MPPRSAYADPHAYTYLYTVKLCSTKVSSNKGLTHLQAASIALGKNNYAAYKNIYTVVT